MAWTREPTYDKPDISVRATTLYYQIVAPVMLPFLDRRLLNLFRCREGQCFFQRNREHPPTGKEFDQLVRFEPVAQKNGRTEEYLFVETTEQIIACAKVQTVEFHGWGSRAGSVETPDRLVIDLDPDPKLEFEDCEGCSSTAAPVVRGARPRELRAAERWQGHPRRRSPSRRNAMGSGP